jgi:hypothetical protein
MSLQAKYDPREDRMRLTLQSAEGTAARTFWVTRRQWLGLLQALVNLPPAARGDETESPPSSEPSRPRLLSSALENAPVPIKAIRLRRLKHGIKLVLVMDGEQGVFIDVPLAGLTQLLAMLRQQAERAGWDVEAALDRLSSALPSAAMTKAFLH